MNAADGFGVYVHIPFCRHRCDYCAFATFTDRDHLMIHYLEALKREIANAIEAGMPLATSIFVGGGTPTRVSPGLLMDVLSAIPVTPDAEITLECNPDDCSDSLMSTYRHGGVNRVSIGVQSLQPHVLRSLGRTHDPDNVVRAVTAARSRGIDNVNLDVIYGAHGESRDDWERTLAGVVALAPSHVSAYGLTVEAGTPLADDPTRHPDDDVQADMYETADMVLSRAGLENYEISNWARPGRECRHNLLYWHQGNYRGFGSAAHSHQGGRRWWNVRTPERYIEAIESGRGAESAHEELDPDTRRREGLQLALRMATGVPADAFDPQDRDDLGHLLEEVDEHRLRLNRNGRLLANEIALRLR
ncbi:MAG: radical SAM family heme chaperone HemW [Ilumatobacteraceae bacterium]